MTCVGNRTLTWKHVNGFLNQPRAGKLLPVGYRAETRLREIPKGRSLINPPQKTLLHQKFDKLNEAVYVSRRKVPLGKSHDQNGGLLHWYNDKTTFDIKSLYREQIDRKYSGGHYCKDRRFGVTTPHSNDGLNMAKSLQWLCDMQKGYSAKFVSKRWDDFRGRMQPQIGKVNNLIADSLKVQPDHTFGILTSFDGFDIPSSAGELIHPNDPCQNRRERDRLVSSVLHKLKNVNFNSFPSLLLAFRHYDKKGEGAIDKEDLQEVCHQLQLELSELVLDNLMDYCDVDKDGLISFLEFSNFLNWKDRMPIDPQDQHILTSECRTSTAPANINSRSLAGSPEPVESKVLIKPEDLEPIEAGSSLKTPQTLSRLRTAPDHFVTSSQIRATVFSHSKTNYRTYGVPSVCTDLMVPRVKRISNTNNYGEESTSTDLLYPPHCTPYGGINEGHFLCPHPKEEIALIFRNVGVNIAKEMFDGVWKLASMRYPAGAVCVDTLHDVLKEIKVL